MMLTHETSVGKQMIPAVIQLAKAIAEGENIIDYEQIYNEIRGEAMKVSKKH